MHDPAAIAADRGHPRRLHRDPLRDIKRPAPIGTPGQSDLDRAAVLTIPVRRYEWPKIYARSCLFVTRQPLVQLFHRTASFDGIPLCHFHALVGGFQVVRTFVRQCSGMRRRLTWPSAAYLSLAVAAFQRSYGALAQWPGLHVHRTRRATADSNSPSSPAPGSRCLPRRCLSAPISPLTPPASRKTSVDGCTPRATPSHTPANSTTTPCYTLGSTVNPVTVPATTRLSKSRSKPYPTYVRVRQQRVVRRHRDRTRSVLGVTPAGTPRRYRHDPNGHIHLDRDGGHHRRAGLRLFAVASTLAVPVELFPQCELRYQLNDSQPDV